MCIRDRVSTQSTGKPTNREMDRCPSLLLKCRETQNNARFFGSRRPATSASCSEEAAVERWLMNNQQLVRKLGSRWFGFFRSVLHIGYGTNKPMLLGHDDYSDDLCSPAVEAVLIRWWERVRQEMAASDPDIPSRRHYHSLVHVDKMLSLLTEFKQDLMRPDALELAVWFRDLQYDPTAPAGENEQQSVDMVHQFGVEVEEALAQDDCCLHVDHILGSEGRKLVSSFIISDLSTGQPLGNRSDAAHFQDFQLSVLASDPKEYEQYSRWIRTEYQHIPMSIYRERRLETIELFLSMEPPSSTSPPASPIKPAEEVDQRTGQDEQLFKVPKLKALWENRARENLAWEYDEIERGAFPKDPMSCE
eukprot:TRINITY_DN1333_c0_g1_i5.p1 TRINITY_DN1333_c0_g1~~TRINITY_DN1333_c0_g1_i5.p1  ORF type:complete len:362 (-),score=83.88 TRINITY_DN1333_c0_g1_i5:414-1499(-)